MPGSAFIEDDRTRISLIGRQALGVASLEPGSFAPPRPTLGIFLGWMEVILDRHLDQDDDRGLQLVRRISRKRVFQAIGDNKRTQSEFKLLIEPLTEKPKSEEEDSTIGYNSLVSHHASLGIHYQPVILFNAEVQNKGKPTPALRTTLSLRNVLRSSFSSRKRSEIDFKTLERVLSLSP